MLEMLEATRVRQVRSQPAASATAAPAKRRSGRRTGSVQRASAGACIRTSQYTTTMTAIEDHARLLRDATANHPEAPETS